MRISLLVRHYGRAVRFSGQIGPAGAPVQIQIQRRFRGRWVTIVRTTTHPISARLAAWAHTIAQPHSGAIEWSRTCATGRCSPATAGW